MTEVLWITQVDRDGIGSHDIVTLDVDDHTWQRINAMPFKYRGSPDGLQPYDVLIDLMDESGINIVSESPMVIMPSKAKWLLDSFFSVERKFVDLVESPGKLAPS